MKFELHHVDILAEDMGKSLAFYQEVLGMQLIFHSDEGGTDVAFLADRANTNFYIELVGPPFIDFQESFFKEHGPSLDHFSFLVNDAVAWYEKLRSEGIKFITKPEEFLGVMEFYFYDASGTIAEMMMFLDPSMSISPSSQATQPNGVEYRLHHFSILCKDIPELERFYVENIGMETIHENREEGYIFLADPEFIADKSRDAPIIELMGPPGVLEREQTFLARHGPGIDHLCFAVDDIDEAYEDLISKGISIDFEPVDYEGHRVAFLKDPNGVDIEIMPTVPRDPLEI